MPLLARLGIAWILGIAMARWLNLPWQVIATASLPALSALFLYRHTSRGPAWAALALALIGGAFRFAFFQPVFDEGHIAFYNDRPAPVKITGLIVDEPDIRDNYINMVLFAFKARASETINRILAEPYASLLNGILLGIETGIPRALYEEFNLTGTSHVIVISGSNIALIAGILLLLDRRVIGKRYAPPY